MRAPIVTTSWDDGHVADLRLAELLERHDVRGTFYVPFRAVRKPLLKPGQLGTVVDAGFEVGAHSVTHPSLAGLPRTWLVAEVLDSKRRLEDILGARVDSFCYPNGRFDRACRRSVRDAGYRLARTTVNLRTSVGPDEWAMPTSLQFFPHDPVQRMRIFASNRDLSGAWLWASRYRCAARLEALADALFADVIQSGGVFHLWGHSWEIDQFDLWRPLERLLARIGGRRDVRYLTNAQTVEAVKCE